MKDILGVCGGNGVILHPFKNRLIANIEPRSIFYTPCQSQWASNFEDIPIVKSPNILGPLKGVNVIIGHPNCGASSVLSYSRRKELGNPRKDHSLGIFIESVNYYKPKVFLMENLETLIKTIPKKELEKQFKKYHLKYIVGSCSIFGNSQKTRKRLVILGFKKKLKIDLSKVNPFPVNEPKKTKDLLRGLKKEDLSLGHIREKNDTIVTIYAGVKMSCKEIQKEWLTRLKDSSRWFVNTPNSNFKTAPGVYRNLKNSYPSTVRKSNREFNPKGLMMSPRERARIQHIPDSFKIYIDPKQKGYWLNKGRVTVSKCPPYDIGLWFKNLLKKLEHGNKKKQKTSS